MTFQERFAEGPPDVPAGDLVKTIPPTWQPAEQARIWWQVEYDRHVAAGFSDADSRLRCWEIARATDDPHKRALAARRRNQ